jgi:hypothetical protein
MTVLTVMVAWPSGCTRNIYQIGTIKTIKHLPLLIAQSERLEQLRQCPYFGRGGETPEMEQRALDHVDRDAGISIRQAVEQLKVLHITIWKVLNEELLYPHTHECKVSFLLIFQFKRTFVQCNV